MSVTAYVSKKDPIGYGEFLSTCLIKEQTSQVDLAKKLNENRTELGRYLKIGRWSERTKAFVKDNRNRISNTDIIKAARDFRTEQEAFQFLQSKVSNVMEEKPILSAELDVELPPTLKDPGGELEWRGLFVACLRPKSIILFTCITLLTMYLIHQGMLFFGAIEQQHVSALANAMVSEAIPLLAAACFTLTKSRARKILTFLILAGSILGLGFFMHSSIKNQLLSGSDRFKRYDTQKKMIEENIQILTNSSKDIPSNFLTKRQGLAMQISQEQARLLAINKTIDGIEGGQIGLDRIVLFYSIWVRIAAMILNAYLVHSFFRQFRREQLIHLL